MATVYTAFHPRRRVAEFLGQPGHEPNGTLLPFAVMDAHAIAVSTRTPEMYAVTGQRVRDDGTRWLDFGITREYSEATSNFRDLGKGKGLTYVCPSCEGHSGTHSKACKA